MQGYISNFPHLIGNMKYRQFCSENVVLIKNFCYVVIAIRLTKA